MVVRLVARPAPAALVGLDVDRDRAPVLPPRQVRPGPVQRQAVVETDPPCL